MKTGYMTLIILFFASHAIGGSFDMTCKGAGNTASIHLKFNYFENEIPEKGKNNVSTPPKDIYDHSSLGRGILSVALISQPEIKNIGGASISSSGRAESKILEIKNSESDLVSFLFSGDLMIQVQKKFLFDDEDRFEGKLSYKIISSSEKQTPENINVDCSVREDD